ncbi:hypothetical protein DPMN_108679, partial [Dreissena polymorpha]
MSRSNLTKYGPKPALKKEEGWAITTDIKDLGDVPPAGGRMTPDGEIQCQLDDIRSKTIISIRTTTTIGTWNVRTMYVAAEMMKS